MPHLVNLPPCPSTTAAARVGTALAAPILAMFHLTPPPAARTVGTLTAWLLGAAVTVMVMATVQGMCTMISVREIFK